MGGTRVAVIGGGVIGLCCAHYLLERGHGVTVLERDPEGHDCCSLGNAGYISPSHFVPLAAPGIVGQAIRWMGDPESPFYAPLRMDPEFLAWGWRFWRASNANRARRAEPLLRDMNLASRALFVALSERTQNEFELEQGGLLALFQTEHGLAEEARHAARARELGMPAEVLDARAAKALEPGLTLDVIGGVHYPLDAHVTPQKFHAALTRLVRERGGEFRFGGRCPLVGAGRRLDPGGGDVGGTRGGRRVCRGSRGMVGPPRSAARHPAPASAGGRATASRSPIRASGRGARSYFKKAGSR